MLTNPATHPTPAHMTWWATTIKNIAISFLGTAPLLPVEPKLSDIERYTAAVDKRRCDLERALRGGV